MIAACTALIALNPQNASAYNNRGATYHRMGQFDHAIEDFTQAIKLRSQDAGLFNSRGLAYGRKGQFDRAIEDYNQAIQLDSKNARFFNDRGRAYANKRQFGRAIEDYDQAIALDPQYVLALLNRGNAYASQYRHDRATEDFSQVIRLDPKNVYALMNRCRIRTMLGRELREASRDCDEVLRLNLPKDTHAGAIDMLAAAREFRAAIDLKLNQFDEAIAAYNAILTADPKNTYALYGRGYAKRKKGDGPDGDADIAAAKALESDVAEKYEQDFGMK